MANNTPYGIWVDSLLFGIFAAIWVQTGISVDPQDLLFGVAQQIIELFSPEMVWLLVAIATIVSIVTFMIMLYGIYKSGPVGIICAFLGGLGGFLVMFPSTVTAAIVCIVGGMLLTLYISEHT